MTGHPDSLPLAWASLLIEELYRLGLRHLCIAPGSRSAPLTLAAANHNGMRCHLHFDERGLGFFALGLAKGLHQPVAIITTSGTAVANLYPAVIEARLTRVPLLVLSADRPAELIDCGANQAITQPGIFASYPVFQQSLPAPELRLDPRFLLGSVDHAWQQLTMATGPVHLNCPFAEPFYPGQGEPLPASWWQPLEHWLVSKQPLTRYHSAPAAVNQNVEWEPGWMSFNNHAKVGVPQPEPAVVNEEPEWVSFSQQRGILVAGEIRDPQEANAVARLAKALGWPLLADVQSQLRLSAGAISHYDLALHSPRFRDQLAEATVLLQVGGRLISKRLNQFISNHPWQQRWLLADHDARLAPDYGLQRRLIAPIALWCATHTPPQDKAPWHQLDRLPDQIASSLPQWLPDWSEPGICHWLCAKNRGPLLLGNSLPVRMMDMVGVEGSTVSDHSLSHVFTNRGASGIDGLIATAAGVATARPDRCTTLLLGDTSALHDLNSLALLSKLTSPLVLLLLNNDGGAIFSLLPGAAALPQLDHFFRLPHGLDFAHAAAQFGLAYRSPRDLAELEQAYTAASQGGVTLIECRLPADNAATVLKALAAHCQSL